MKILFYHVCLFHFQSKQVHISKQTLRDILFLSTYEILFKKPFSTHACKTVRYESIKTSLAGKRNKGERASSDHQFLTIVAYAHKRKAKYWRMFRNANNAWPTTKTSCNLKSIKITEIITKKMPENKFDKNLEVLSLFSQLVKIFHKHFSYDP